MAELVQNEAISQGESAHLDRADWSAFCLTTGLTLVGYLFTLAPEVTLGWGGILTASAMYGGVGPPAGNPAWTIYSWFFIKLLPFSNPAWRVAVGSAVAGAVSCGLVALIVSRSARLLFAENSAFSNLAPGEQKWIRCLSGYVAGMALGYSDAFWNEALIPDFVTFTSLLFSGILWLLLRWLETGNRQLCACAFLLCGVLLTNSQEMIAALPGIAGAALLMDRKFGRDLCLLLLPVAAALARFTQYPIWYYGLINWPLLAAFTIPVLISIVVINTSRRLGSEWKPVLTCTLCFVTGLALYLDLPIVSATNPPVNWAYPRTLEGFIHSLSRGQFERVFPVQSFPVFLPSLWCMLLQTGQSFGWLYVTFAILPFCFFPRMTAIGRNWIGALGLVALCAGPLLVTLLTVPADRQMQEIVEPYFFPLRVILSIFTGIGLMIFAAKVACISVATPKHEIVSPVT